MHNAFVMGGLQRERDLTRDLGRFVERHRTTLDTIRQGAAFEQLEHQHAAGWRLFESVDGADVRMIERRQQLRLALEARHALGIIGQRRGQQLQRDVAAERGIAGAIDLAHAAGAEQRDDLVRAEDRAWHHGLSVVPRHDAPQSPLRQRFPVVLTWASTMTLAPGTRLGVYEIHSALGAGGMGEVYRARDTRLQRDVALKILPDAFAADTDRLARFEREAQMLASLNHPNIAAIHGLEESGSVRALVTGARRRPHARRPHRRRPAVAYRRGARHRAADRGGAAGGPRAGRGPSRSETRQHQGAARRHGESARLRIGEARCRSDDRRVLRRRSEYRPDVSRSPTITTPAMTLAWA